MTRTSTMHGRALRVSGAVEFVPASFPDDRGSFCSPLQHSTFRAVVGRSMFSAVQANHSVSRYNVARGIHFTATAEGTEKYVFCSAGSARDFVVDLRPSSPSFGCWDSVRLDSGTMNAVYLPAGMGHAFVATAEHTAMSYLLSTEYVAEYECAISLFDPQIGLPLSMADGLVLSERDLVAQSLDEAWRDGMLFD